MEKSLLLKLNDCSTCDDIKNANEENITAVTSDHEESEQEDSKNSENEVKNDNYDSESFEEDDDDDINDLERNFIVESLRMSELKKPLPNKTFSTYELRDIERNNEILMSKILSNNKRANQYKVAPRATNHNKISSSAINRRKNQDKIDRDNQILLKKIQTVRSCVNRK
ncbi:hypothetical protein NQ318_002921 [Aromia moschata]|uniref:Cilia- and flagella-associated protein 97-like n=1 Tax=Aromia moschata TaxID=1265417 RepID=A0AAV8Y6N7_9CUCU|nr:hypothetical protein NQ318_002921 [Aromia moschata]